MSAAANRCGHCGREGTLEVAGDAVVKSTTQVVGAGTIVEDEATVQQVARVERCTRCDGLTLSRYTWVDGYFDPEDVDPTVVFPKPRNVADLPDDVRKLYGKMLEIQFEPDAFAVRAGKVLEAVCADQGVMGTNFYERLETLVHQAGVPKPLVDQAHVVREYRNLGGHYNAIEVEAADVPAIRGFVEALLTYLYWGPGELRRTSEALEQRRNALNK